MENDKQLSDEETVLNPGGDQNPTESDHHGSVVPYNVPDDLFSRYGDAYFDMFPPGYRFKPHDDELVVHYLKRKIMKMQLPPNKIREVELYKSNPQDLAAAYSSHGDKDWYFFTPRDRKYKNGERPNRAAGDGYWKATGADKPVRSNGAVVGSRKALVFYRGRPPRGVKTDWIMHEFRVENPCKRKRGGANDMRLDDWVLCRLYKKVDKKNKGSVRPSDTAVPDQEPENEIPQTFQDHGHLPMGGSKMLPQESFLPEGLESLDQLYGYYNSASQMELNPFDNAQYFHGSQSSFPGVHQSFYPQLGQNQMVHHFIPGYQNPNLMMPEPFPSTESHIKNEQFNDYQSDELLNFPPEANYLDQIVSNFMGPSNSVIIPSFPDDRGASSCVILPPSNGGDKKNKRIRKHS